VIPVATLLFYLDQLWLRGAGVWDDMPVTTAQGLAALLIGPSPLIVAKLPLRLFGVAIFWTWLGFFLDRWRSAIREPMIRSVWLRVVLYSLGPILALLFAWKGSTFLRLAHAELDYLWRCVKSTSPHRTLLGRELTTLTRLLWGITYAAYFSLKLWQVCRFSRSGILVKADD
jgi:hypothetical protein